MKIILLSMITLLVLTGCLGGDNKSSEGVWTSFIYPDKANIKRSMEYGKFQSLEECTKASVDKLNELGLSQRGFVECGLNCSFNEGMKTLVCERVVKK